MNKTPTELDYLAAHIGYMEAARRYPYSLVYRYAGSDHVWTLYFHAVDARKSFADNLRGLGGRVVGASQGDTSGLV